MKTQKTQSKIAKAFFAIGTLLLAGFMITFSTGCAEKLSATSISPGDMAWLKGTSSGNPGSGLISFKTVFTEVLENNCVSCHNSTKAAGGVRYDTYEAAIQNGELKLLHDSYATYSEPNKRCSTIKASQMDLVRAWIEAGAPQ